jgi:hypothetical protein
MASASQLRHRVVVDGRDLHNPTGGPEALLQLSLAFRDLLGAPLVRLLCDRFAPPYAPRFLAGYESLVDECVREPRAGDLLIVPHVRACLPRHLAKGVRVVRYWLASGSYDEWAAKRANQWRRSPCSGELAHSEAGAARIARWAGCTPLIVHPYLSPLVVAQAPQPGSLDQVVGRARATDSAALVSGKRNVAVLNHDLRRLSGGAMLALINASTHAAGGTVVLADGLEQSELIALYRVAKAVVAWCMHGAERIPLEASLFGAGRRSWVERDTASCSVHDQPPLPPTAYLLTYLPPTAYIAHVRMELTPWCSAIAPRGGRRLSLSLSLSLCVCACVCVCECV